MKKLLLAALLSAVVLTACGGPEDSGSAGVDDFSIDGTWTSENQEQVQSSEGYDSGPVTMEVLESEGQTFVAEVTWGEPEGGASAQFVGAMTPDSNLIAGASEEGNYTFSVVDENTLDFCFTEPSDDYLASCGQFTRD